MQIGRCCQCSPPPPVPGTLTRSVIPTAIADYEGIATGSWTTMSCTTASGSFTCYVFHHVAGNVSVAGSTYILPPIRYSIHEPTTNGDIYDSVGKWDLYSGQFANSRNYRHIGNATYKNTYIMWPETHYAFRTVSPVENCGRIGMINTVLPVSGNSHAVFETDSIVSGPRSGPDTGAQPWFGDGEYMMTPNAGGDPGTPVPELAAIAPAVSWSPLRGAEPYAIRHRVNGAAVGSLKTFPLRAAEWTVALAAGDEYEADVWWRVVIPKMTYYGNKAFKHAIWIPVTNDTNGSYYPPAQRNTGLYSGNREPRLFSFSGVNFAPDYNSTTQTYQLALTGAHSWALQNGTQTQKIANVGGWTEFRSGAYLRWRSLDTLTAVGTMWFFLDFYCEHAHLTLYSSELNEWCVYAPQNTGDYVTSTSSTDWGNVSWGPRGCFNQAGSTTFEPREQPFDGYKTGTISSINTEFPTSIVVTRVSR